MKCTDELKACAVEFVIHAQADPDTANGAITRIAGELSLNKATLRASLPIGFVLALLDSGMNFDWAAGISAGPSNTMNLLHATGHIAWIDDHQSA